MSRHFALLALMLLTLQGCGTTPAPPAAPAAPPATAPGAPPAASAASRVSALAAEGQWLKSWFEGTPVLIVLRDDTALSIEVPREFCFDTGRSNVKPALAAVLDKVAESLRRKPALRLELVAAPGDSAATSALGPQRATRLRAYLLARGVPAAQLGQPTVTAAAAVQLRMEPMPR
ncbi:MAG: OmpA family protein [Rubrivivax sp.]